MKKLYIICVLIIAVMITGSILALSQRAQNQQEPLLRIEQIPMTGPVFTAQVRGRVVGFSCNDRACFIATVSESVPSR